MRGLPWIYPLFYHCTASQHNESVYAVAEFFVVVVVGYDDHSTPTVTASVFHMASPLSQSVAVAFDGVMRTVVYSNPLRFIKRLGTPLPTAASLLRPD
jgi:hypothetical protein